MSEPAINPFQNVSSSPEQVHSASDADLRENTESPPVLLSEERKQALLTFWRDTLSGKIQPEVLRVTPEVEAAVRSEERRFPGPISAAAKKRLLEDYALSRYHGGRPVVCLHSPAGCAVLADGTAELLFFEESVPPEQRRRLRITYPGPWEQEEAPRIPSSPGSASGWACSDRTGCA